MGYRDSILKLEGRLLNLDRKLEIGKAARLFLVKRKPNSGRLMLHREITSLWSVRWNEFRGQMTVLVGALDTAFPDDVIVSSFIAYGVPRGVGLDTYDCFEMAADQKEVIPPVANNPYWKVFCTLSNERYIHSG